MERPLRSLPKAHLHLHLTGAMRHATLVELAARTGSSCPTRAGRPVAGAAGQGADERGWFRFQRLYDIARSVLRTRGRRAPAAARDRRGRGGRRLGLAGDPGGPVRLRGAVRRAHRPRWSSCSTRRRRRPPRPGSASGSSSAANRTRHPLDARTLARLAAAVRRARGHRLRAEQRRAARLDRRLRAGLPDRDAGRAAVGAARRRAVRPRQRPGLPGRAARRPDRARHRGRRGSRAAAPGRGRAGDRCEVCPSSNVALGVFGKPADVPLRRLLEAGVPVALGADDPLLFGSRLTAQYDLARRRPRPR